LIQKKNAMRTVGSSKLLFHPQDMGIAAWEALISLLLLFLVSDR
jgi:hypothetical protein